MDDWVFSLKSASSQKNLEPIFDQHDILSNNHQWYSTYHARPTYCNVCREALPGVTSHGLSCEICKCKVHKRCAAKAISNCKWTTLASVGKDIIENKDGSIIMPHQWMEGNLPVASICSECRKTCGSVLRLQDWRCLWCRATVHSACRSAMPQQCQIGPAKLSVVPPTSVHSIGIDDSLDIVCPKGSFSPLLVFVNSKSGDNQGIKFLRRFKQLLNPAQVFDLISTGPSLGLRLFRHFDTFRILVCSGDGSVGWVLSEIDRFNMHKQCQVAVLPLGTGNDLARVLGWGSSCEDDAHLPQVLERYESASTKMLDRWSIMVFEKSISMKSSEMLLTSDQEAMLTGLVTSTIENLELIVETDDTCILLSAVRILCENIDELSDTYCKNRKDDEQLIMKCDILRQKLNMLVDALRVKDISEFLGDDAFEPSRKINTPEAKDTNMSSICTMEKTEKDQINSKEWIDSIKLRPIEKTNLQCRANSVKRAIYNVVEHSEPGRPKRYERKLSINPFETIKQKSIFHESFSPITIPPINIISPSNSTTQLLCVSPRPDLVDDNTLCTLSLPVPSQFADDIPHSGVFENIQFNENIDHSDIRTPHFLDSNLKTHVEKLDSLAVPILAKEEVFDELYNFHHNEKLQKGDFLNQYSNSSRSVQITKVFASANETSLTERENDEGLSIIDNCGNKSQSEAITAENSKMEVTAENLDACHSTPLIGIMQNLMLDSLAHIDSPDTSDEIEENPGGTSTVGKSESFTAPYSDNDIIDVVPNKNITSRQSFPLIQKPCKHSIEKKNQQFGFENIVFEIDNRCDDQKIKEPPKYCTLAKFVQGNEFDHSTLKNIASSDRYFSESLNLGMNETEISQDFNTTKTLQSTSDTMKDATIKQIFPHQNKKINNPITEDAKRITFDDSCKKESRDDDFSDYSQINLIAGVPSVMQGVNSELLVHESCDLRRHSSHYTSLSPREYQSDNEKYRRHSGYNTKNLSFDPEHIRFLNCSPAATRRISCGSLIKLNEGFSIPKLKASKTNILTNSSGLGQGNGKEKDEKSPKEKELMDDERQKLPIINPFVRLPSWPNINNGSGFISKCLLANADTLCAAVSPLMDPDETLLEGYHEKCVMNNYFGIGIDAKISLDFHNKREEHPEQCRSRARNYMWYGVLGSKQLLQKTYKNLEQRVQLECDGQRIPLPSLQGIVILNIPSFMGGTNFWGGTRKDDIFLAPSFDDRILEVVAVFGSAQMAASRLINLQHHRIAQCQSVQINILGNEEVPIQVDGEAWLQPPGMIRILHKNRVQMLCRNKQLETSLKQWEEKKRQHSISIQMNQSLTSLDQGSNVLEDNLSEGECNVLLNLIEAIYTLVKWVKFLIISHPSLRRDLYIVANRASDALESIHPNGTLLEGPILRIQLVEVIDSSRHLYNDTCSFLRDRGPSLILREDLEAKLSAALANIEIELKKCSVLKCIDGKIRAYFNDAISHGDLEARKKGKPFWVRLRSGSTAYKQPFRQTANTRDAVCNWSVYEVVTWLETMQLSEYVDNFVKNDIRGKELLSLSRRDLKDLGVVKVGHIKRILEAIKDLCKH